MRQDDRRGQIVGPPGDGCRHRLWSVEQVAPLSVGADDDVQAVPRELRQDAVVPARSTFGPGRLVTRGGRSWVAEAHGDKCDSSGVVELLRCDSEPASQGPPTRVVPRDARHVNLSPGGLSDDHDSGCGTGLHDRSGTEREHPRTDRARPDAGEQVCQLDVPLWCHPVIVAGPGGRAFGAGNPRTPSGLPAGRGLVPALRLRYHGQQPAGRAAGVATRGIDRRGPNRLPALRREAIARPVTAPGEPDQVTGVTALLPAWAPPSALRRGPRKRSADPPVRRSPMSERRSGFRTTCCRPQIECRRSATGVPDTSNQTNPRSSAPFRQKNRSRVCSSNPDTASPNSSKGRRPPSGCG